MPVQTLRVVITFLTMLRLQQKLCWQVGARESRLWMSTVTTVMARKGFFTSALMRFLSAFMATLKLNVRFILATQTNQVLVKG